MSNRRTEYLNKSAAAKRTGLSVRRLLELAQRGTIRKQFVNDPHTKRKIAVFFADDLDKLKDAKPFWQMAGQDLRPLSGSDAVSVAALPQSGKHLNELLSNLLDAASSKLPPASAPAAREWMTLAEADAYCGLPESFLLVQVKSGKLPALDVGVRPGGRWRVSKRDLEAISGEKSGVRRRSS